MNTDLFTEKSRPCITRIFLNGAADETEFKKGRHVIAVECKRLNIDKSEAIEIMFDWNTRNHKPLSGTEAQRQLHDYIEWVYKNNCFLSCKGLKPICTGERSCKYSRDDNSKNHVSYTIAEAAHFLEKEYRPHGYSMAAVLGCLLSIRDEKKVSDILYVSYREISSRLRVRDRIELFPTEILRLVQRLRDAGLIEIIPGKSGQFHRQATGYRFLQWSRPAVTAEKTHITQCVTK